MTTAGAAMDVGHVEVEWAADDRTIQRAELRTVAGTAFEDAAPIRRSSSYRGQRHFPGWYWTATSQTLLGFESWLERDRAILLDRDARVVGLAAQPFRLIWPGARRPVVHVPDYFARLADGSGLVVDVRPADRVRAEDAVKFQTTAAICQQLGCWSYELAHEPDPVLMSNVRWLAGYRHPRHRLDGVAQRLREVFAVPAGLLAAAEQVGDPIAVLPVLFHLLWCGELVADLDVALHDATVICLPGTAP